MENQLSTSYQMLMDIALEHTGNSIAVLEALRDESGKIVDFELRFLNRQAQSLAMRNDLVGKHLLVEYPTIRSSELFERCVHTVNTGQAWNGELSMNSNTGRWLELTLKSQNDFCIVTCYKTGDTHQQARRAASKYVSLFNSIEQGFCIVETLFNDHGFPSDYRFLETNPSFVHHTGLQNVIGKTLRELLPGNYEHWFNSYGISRLSATPKHVEIEVPALGRCYDAYAFNIEGTAEHQIGIIFNDITQRKRAEEHQKYLLTLTDALNTLSNSLDIKNAACRVINDKLSLKGAAYYNFTKVNEHEVFKRAAYCYPHGEQPIDIVPIEKCTETLLPLLTGKTLVINNVVTDVPLHEQQFFLGQGVVSFVAVPLLQQNKCFAFFTVQRSQPCQWASCEQNIVKETALRTWELIGRARAKDALREAEINDRVQLEEIVKQRTRELMESRDFVTAITRTVPELITIHDVASTKMIYYNHDQNWARPFVENGMPELPGKKRAPLVIFPDDLPKAVQFVKERALLADNEVLEIELRARIGNGDWGWIRIASKVFKRNADGSAAQVLSVTSNITDQKLNELTFREQANFIKGITKTMPDLVVVAELPSRRIIYYNDEPTRMTGYTREELNSLDPSERLSITVYHEDRHLLESFYNKLAKMETDDIIQVEYRFRKKSGGLFWARLRAKVYLRDDNGTPLRSLQIGQDITAEKESHQKLREALDQFRNLVNNTPDTITRWNEHLQMMFANPAFEAKTGAPASAMLGRTPTEMSLPSALAIPWMEKLRTVFRTGKATEHYNTFPTPAGNAFYYTRMVPELNDQGQVSTVLAIARDVSQIKETEKELGDLRLLQQKKILNAIIMTQEKERKRIGEELHDGVGQLLYGVLARVQSFKNVEPAKMNEVLDIVQEAIKEVRSISFELVPSVLKDHGLEVALRSLFQRVLPQQLEMLLQVEDLKNRLPERLEFAIYRIIQELVTNTVKHAEASQVKINIGSQELGIRVSVSDNGKGFNLTKIDPMSTGIGLQSVKNRVKLLGGSIHLRSGREGTQVEIMLPNE